LRERIEALLRSQESPDNFLDVPVLLRQAGEAGNLPTGAFDTPVGGRQPPTAERPAADPERGAAGTAPIDEAALAFLAPSREPGSLGRLDNYEILEVVGRGGMGVVFRARDTKLQRVVAIKLLAPHLAANGTSRKRFIREAQAAAAVRDDHVVDIHAVHDDGPVPYLVMGFIAGITLEDRVKQGRPLEVKEVLRIGIQAARGLAVAHAQGLIHRDVKPANILLENGVQRVKITDFGLARAVDDAGLTQSGVIAGTPLYMSPEQARGEAVDHRSDLFSLGSVLYMLCTGRLAFRASKSMAVLKRVCDDTPGPIREVNPDIPECLAAAVNKLLAKDPAERFQSAAELAELLGHYLARLQHPSLVPPRAPSARQPESAGPALRKRRRYGTAAVLLGSACVGAILVALAVLSRAWVVPPPGDRPEGGTPAAKNGTQPPDGRRVLTVSKDPASGGQFRTIAKALDQVEPGMTVRVLDDAVYEEHLVVNHPEHHRGVVLEAVAKAVIRRAPGVLESVWIRGVPDFTLRGFRFEYVPDKNRHCHVFLTGLCSGVILDQLDITAGHICIYIHDVPLSGNDAPVVIQKCRMRAAEIGACIEGSAHGNPDRPLPSAQVVIRENTFVECNGSVRLQGEVHRVQVVGNHILDAAWHGIDLADLLPGTEQVLVANNTLLRNNKALLVWDDHAKGKAFLKCKTVRFQNNLVLDPLGVVDLAFLDHHPRGIFGGGRPGDVESLLKSPQWCFSHNWREYAPLKPDHPEIGYWIPGCPDDHL
jgi:tRNA A-37 threonylcarbamoyl transferase component Bud32